MELNEWSTILEWIFRIAAVVVGVSGIALFLVNKKIKAQNEERVGKIEEQVVANNYEGNKLNDLKNELASYLSESDLESVPKIINVQIPPTDKQIEVVLNFLKSDLANAKPVTNNMGIESNTINVIAGSIAKLFDSSSSKDKFEKVIEEISNNTIASNKNAKTRILHGIIGYFSSGFEDKINLMVELSENTIGLKYEEGKSPSISFEYFTNLMGLLRSRGNEFYFSYLNNEEFINKLNEKGIIDEFNSHFPESNGKTAKKYFRGIEKTYLFQFLN